MNLTGHREFRYLPSLGSQLDRTSFSTHSASSAKLWGRRQQMIIEMRTYKTKPGKRIEFLEIFRSKSVPAHQKRSG